MNEPKNIRMVSAYLWGKGVRLAALDLSAVRKAGFEFRYVGTDFESNAFEVDIYEVEGYEFPDGVPNEENGLFARIGKKVDYPYDW